MGEKGNGRAGWTFLSNHGHVIMCLAADRDMRLRDIAASIGITERAVQQIIADLEAAGVLTRSRLGRRNRYDVRRLAPLRHPVEQGITVGDFMDLRGCQTCEEETREWCRRDKARNAARALHSTSLTVEPPRVRVGCIGDQSHPDERGRTADVS